MEEKAKEHDFYEHDVDVQDPIITTYDMREMIQLVHNISDSIGDHNNISESNMVLEVVLQAKYFLDVVTWHANIYIPNKRFIIYSQAYNSIIKVTIEAIADMLSLPENEGMLNLNINVLKG